jgi:hypothetical protein
MPFSLVPRNKVIGEFRAPSARTLELFAIEFSSVEAALLSAIRGVPAIIHQVIPDDAKARFSPQPRIQGDSVNARLVF